MFSVAGGLLVDGKGGGSDVWCINILGGLVGVD